MRRLLLLLTILTASLNFGCVSSMITNGQISATRKASTVFGTIGDYEVARGAVFGGLVQMEGMHRLAPENEDALFMLTQAWVGYGFAFAEDDMEVAIDAGNDAAADYHKERAKMAYDRAVLYGLELLSHKGGTLTVANRRNAATMKAWLAENFDDKEDAPNLFWTGYGWMARTSLLRDQPEVVAELFVGLAMVERSVELDPEFMHHTGTLALAAYHARSGFAEMSEGKRLFEDTLAKTQRKSLVVQLNYAKTYACLKVDRKLYETLLNEIIASGDLDPEQRLNNTIAKRRAKRMLGKDRMMNCGFDMSAPPVAQTAP